MEAVLSAKDEKLYERLAFKIHRWVEQGTLKPGEKIPSVRAMSLQQRVSVSTVLQAYFLLENQGVIEARPQSGFYVRALLKDLPPEPSVSKVSQSTVKVGVSDLVSRVYEAVRRPDVVPLGAAAPSPDLLPTVSLHRKIALASRRFAKAGISYDPPPGNEALRHQIARRSIEWGGTLSPDKIVTTCGGMEALNLCLRAVARSGDTVAIESPTYYGVLQAMESLGIKVVEIPTHPKDGASLSDLKLILKKHKLKACLMIPNFNNPLGSCMPEENKKELVKMLSRERVPLIEDDIYGDLYFGALRPKPAKAFDRDGWVMLCSSFSKTLAPGYRVGWVAAGRFQAEIERLKFINTVATATLPQIAIADFLETGGYDRHLRKLRRAFASQVQRVTEAIHRYFPKGTRVTRPQGGFVLWVELPPSVSSLDLHHKALKEGISIVPGPIFSPSQKYLNFIRLNCGHPWSERMEAALKTLGGLAGGL